MDPALRRGHAETLLGEADRFDRVLIPASTASRAFFTRVFSSERTARFRCRRRSFERFRLIWLLMFATWFLT